MSEKEVIRKAIREFFRLYSLKTGLKSGELILEDFLKEREEVIRTELGYLGECPNCGERY